jgi:hypothetical protein
MAPNVETTRSKLAFANGRSWASPSTHSTSTPASAARRRCVLEELGCEIQADDLRAAKRSRNRDVASCARPDVQQVETRTKVDALEDDRAHRFDQPRVGVPVTGRPHRSCPLLEVGGSRHAATLTDLTVRLDPA